MRLFSQGCLVWSLHFQKVTDVYKSIELLPTFLTYRNITAPSISYAHEQCCKPKKDIQKVNSVEKTTVICQSISTY